MNVFLTLTFLFSIGSMLGWCIEVIFRRFVSAKKWINPGFLTGPCLPLYGFSLCVLYLLAGLERYIPIENVVAERLLLFVLMALCITLLEYFAGITFITHMQIKLWDYSNEPGNIRGVICPRYSAAWAFLSAVYYFLIHPRILNTLIWLSNNLAFSFCIGFFYGILVIDMAYSINLISKVRAFAKEKEIVVKYEEFREHIRNVREEQREKVQFLFSLPSPAHILTNLSEYYEKNKDNFKKRGIHKHK